MGMLRKSPRNPSGRHPKAIMNRHLPGLTSIRLILVSLIVSLLAGCAGPGPYEQAPNVNQLSFDSGAMLRVAQRLQDAGDYMAALRMYRQVREQEPKNVQALMGEGELLLALGAASEAEKRFRAARTHAPRNDASMAGAASTGLGMALLRQNRPGDALRYFEESLQKPDPTVRTYNGYGVALDLLDRHGDAQVAYGEGLDLEPDNLLLTNNLALSFALGGSHEAALRILGKLVSERPDAPGARQNLALVYGLSGDRVSARRITAIDLKDDAIEERMTYIDRVAALPRDAQAEAIILGIVPEAVEPTTVPTQQTEKPGDLAPTSGSETVAAVPTPTSSATPEAEPVSEPTPTSAAEPDVTSENEDSLLATPGPAYLVQLGAYLAEGAAERGWRALSARAPDILGSRTPAYPIIEMEEDGETYTVVRMGVAVEEGYAAASGLCADLKEAGVDCLVRRLVDESAP